MKTITIINQYSGNKGDRAVCYFLLNEISKLKDIKIILSTNNPKNWINEEIIKLNKIKVIPWGWNVENFNPKNRIHWEKRRAFRLLVLPYLIKRINNNKKGLGLASLFLNSVFVKSIKSSDLIISTGGHHLTTRFTPDCHNELLHDLIAATLINPNLLFWSQTFGPFIFISDSSKRAVSKILNQSRNIYIRDLKSYDELNKLNIDKSLFHKTYESVIGLNSVIKDYSLPSKRENIVGITIYNAESRDENEYLQYCTVMGKITDWLIGGGYVVKFFPHELIGAGIDDRRCIHDIFNHIMNKDKVIIENRDLTTEEHLHEISECKLFIGHKTHSIIFALTVGTPLIAISYHPKTVDFMKEYLLENNLIDETQLSFESFKNVFTKIENDIDNIGLIEFNQSRLFSESLKSDLRKELNTL